jgi:hypothetical protein
MQECVGALRRLWQGADRVGAALRFTLSGSVSPQEGTPDTYIVALRPRRPGLATVTPLVRCDIGVPSPTPLTAINKDRGQTEHSRCLG